MHVASYWSLFIDFSQRNLKAMPLHNENALPFIPVAFSGHSKETYDNIVILLQDFKYNTPKWTCKRDLQNIAVSYVSWTVGTL